MLDYPYLVLTPHDNYETKPWNEADWFESEDAARAAGGDDDNIYVLLAELREAREEVERLRRSRVKCHEYAGCTADNCKLDGEDCALSTDEGEG